MKTYISLPRIIFVLLFSLCTNIGFSQTVVNSLTTLLPYLDDDNVDVKLAPGTYWITKADVDNGLYNSGTTILGTPSVSLLLFEGNNSTYDFTGVIINVESTVSRAYGNIFFYEINTTGNDNVLKNLTLVDVGDLEDSPYLTLK